MEPAFVPADVGFGANGVAQMVLKNMSAWSFSLIVEFAKSPISPQG
jgi:hypothetical protein